MGNKKLKLTPELTSVYPVRNRKREPKKIGCRILIVCEGEKTEPNYFRGFNQNSANDIVYELDIEGIGANTTYIVDKAIELKNSAEVPYDRVWAVFDKDDFTDDAFNRAIIKAGNNDVEVAWSNEAFELWFLYHFCYVANSMKRSDFQKAISNAVNSSLKKIDKKRYKYQKNDTDNYSVMTTYGDQAQAIKWAKKKHEEFDDQRFATHNPCTTVYKLVRQLIGEDKALTNEVMAKINGKSAPPIVY